MGDGVPFVCMFLVSYVGFVRNSFTCVILRKKQKGNQNTKQQKSETQKKGTFDPGLLSYDNVAVK